MDSEKALASGVVEKIGEATSTLTHNTIGKGGNDLRKVKRCKILDHQDGFNQIVKVLVDRKYGVLRDKSEICAVGHRVVHGGETFQAPTIIDEKVIEAISVHISLAPLHNPPNLIGIEVARSMFPNSPQVAVFDTAFHQTLPQKAFLYALPYELYKKNGVRRYGFHGTSHSYVAQKAAQFFQQPLEKLSLITVHLGNGASMAAIKNGTCIDTTMGLTPLEGLVMGTRCGDVDPSLTFFLANHLQMSLQEIDKLMNKESGLKGICGSNDMREVLEKAHAGEVLAQVALDVYCYRIKKYIGAFFAVLESLDGLVFTAGIGENAPYIRMICCQGLSRLGISIDPQKNNAATKEIREISSSRSKVTILVVPTNEELKIAHETKKLIECSR